MKNIKNQSEDKFYTSPREERIHRKFDVSKWESDFADGKTVHHWIYRFIKKHIGYPINYTYSKFLSSIKENEKGLPKVIDGWSLEKIFKSFFYGYYPDFKVEDGIIGEIPRGKRHIKEKFIYEYPKGHNYRYTLKNELRNDQTFRDITIYYYGYNMYDKIKSNLTETEKDNILYLLNERDYYRKWYLNKFGNYFNLKDIFTQIDLAPKVQVEYTNSMRKKDLGECKDARNKSRREHLIEREKQISDLLHNLEEEKKRIEVEKNSIDIERHGFDEKHSFRGEIYHGQKRKKK